MPSLGADNMDGQSDEDEPKEYITCEYDSASDGTTG